MMTCQGNECVWILLLAVVMVCHQEYVTDSKVNSNLKQPNVMISRFNFNSVNISWEAEEIADKGNFTVCYQLTYQFLDEEKWRLLTKNYDILRLGMHTRLIGSVSTALCENTRIHSKSKPAQFVYNAPPVYINNVSCILFNITNLNCSWNFRPDAPDDTNYLFALRLYSKWLTCKHHFKRQKKNVGCYMQDVFSGLKEEPLKRIWIGFFSDSYNFSKTFRPEVVEILNPPRNIQVLSENRNTIVKWLPPVSIVISGFEDGLTSSYDPEEEDDFFYEIRIIENKSKEIFRQTDPIERTEQTFTDLAKDKTYYLQIRARHKCELCKIWGEWSAPIYINKDYSVFPDWILIVFVPALFATLGFYFCNRYIKMMLLTQIPHPSQNIKNWLHMNESNNIRQQANIAEQNEQTELFTEIEIATTIDTAMKKMNAENLL